MYDEVLTTAEVSRILKITPDTLRTWRKKKIGPKFFKFSKTSQSHARYLRSEITTYLQKKINQKI